MMYIVLCKMAAYRLDTDHRLLCCAHMIFKKYIRCQNLESMDCRFLTSLKTLSVFYSVIVCRLQFLSTISGSLFGCLQTGQAFSRTGLAKFSVKGFAIQPLITQFCHCSVKATYINEWALLSLIPLLLSFFPPQVEYKLPFFFIVLVLLFYCAGTYPTALIYFACLQAFDFDPHVG